MKFVMLKFRCRLACGHSAVIFMPGVPWARRRIEMHRGSPSYWCRKCGARRTRTGRVRRSSALGVGWPMTYKIDTAGCRKALAAVGLGVVVGLVLFYLLIVKLSS